MDTLILQSDSHFKRYIKDKVIKIRDKLANFKVKSVILNKEKKYVLVSENNKTYEISLKEVEEIEIEAENIKLEVHYLLE